MTSGEPLDYFAQPIDDFGHMTGQGFSNLLGAPAASPIETLLREAIQNSWDARLPGATKIGFDIEYRQLSADESQYLATNVLSETPPNVTLSGTPSVLVIRDSNTRGLAGPIRASQIADGHNDFVNFVYMIGETKPLEGEAGVSGGTYGYGRSSLFRVSGARIVLVHSRAFDEKGSRESRLIGIGWSPRFERNGRQFTGRHWWGERREDDWVGPVVGERADLVMDSLGINISDGTTIVVIEPVLEEPESAKEEVCDAILKNAWPKIVLGEVDFRLHWNGVKEAIPDPRKHPVFRNFCRAFDATRDEEKVSARRFPIEIYRPEKHLGWLGLSRSMYVRGVSASAMPLTGEENPLRHVALMRSNHLVVEYSEGVRPLDSEQYVGCFVVDPEVEDVFARSEPPTHDEWVPQRLSDRTERSYVNVAGKRILEATRSFVQPQLSSQPIAKATGLASVAKRLSGILPITVPTSEAGGGGTGGTSNGARARVSVLSSALNDREIFLERVLVIGVEHKAGSRGTVLRPRLQVSAAGGVEGTPPLGAETPKNLMFQLAGSSEFLPVEEVDGLWVAVTFSEVKIRFEQPRNCEVRFTLEIDSKE